MTATNQELKLTIITINRNNVSGLEKTIKSVISQEKKNFEYIIVDGDSTDGSQGIVDMYANELNVLSSYTFISEPDNGIYNAMNKGIQKASGEYCLFLNSGDWFTDSLVVENFMSTCNGSDICFGYVIEENTLRKISLEFEYITPRTLFGKNIPHQAEFIKRSLFSVIGMYSEDLKVLSDWELNVKCAIKGVRFQNLHILVSYVEDGGISNTNLDLLSKEGSVIKNRLFDQGILNDYLFWTNKKTYANPTIEWVIRGNYRMKMVAFLYRLFG